MVISMAAFAVEDTFVKTAAEMLPVGQILIVFGLGGLFLFACIAKLNKDRLFAPDAFSPTMRVRMLFEIAGRLFYVLAISLTPLSATMVILQATPLVVILGAAIVFREKVGLRRWIAVFVGLIGVVIVVGPGTDSFSVLSVLGVIGLLGFAGRDLASRVAPITVSTSMLGFYGFVSVFVAGVLFAAWERAAFVWPDVEVALCLVGSVLVGVAAYASLMKAMRTGEVSAVTPFRYTRLLFGIGFGVLLFGELLSIQMLIGSGLIVVSGLCILWKKRSAAATA
ncbi:EamA-like transporter family protein [Planctomycetes bacterium K23_9]|uniref:EamA-like transporter family protein n=2 Tax=Stieleria marina TaxID=1930275 RepID=A0A517NT01_9BACT|nr:EamA-like transporter family protein [Planctomycetes bacterium K23_9]